MYRAVKDDINERLRNPKYLRDYGAELAKVAFALLLSEARVRAGLTQKDLAELLGHSQPYIAKLESGEANPTLAAIGSMLAAINLRLVVESAPVQSEPIYAPSTPLSATAVLPSWSLAYEKQFSTETLKQGGESISAAATAAATLPQQREPAVACA